MEYTLGSCPGSPPRHPHCPPWWRSFHFPSAHRRRHKRCTWTLKMKLPSYSKVRMTSYPSRALWTNCESSSKTSAWPVCGPNTRSNSKSYLRPRNNHFHEDSFGFLITRTSWTWSSFFSPEVLVGPLDPEHVATAVVLVQLRPDQRPIQVLGGSELKLWQLARGQVSVKKTRSDC